MSDFTSMEQIDEASADLARRKIEAAEQFKKEAMALQAARYRLEVEQRIAAMPELERAALRTALRGESD